MTRIKELTALRGIFMVMIFLFHEHVYSGGGTLGVTFFFVLSGFSLTLGYYDKIQDGRFYYRPFIKKRLVKFIPLHWLTLVLAVILKGSIAIYSVLSLEFTANALLLQSWVPLESFYLSFNSVSWFLADTLFFVAIFPFIIRWVQRTVKSRQITMAITVLLLYIVLIALLPHKLYSPILYINPIVRLLDFVIGIYMALWVKKSIIGSVSTNKNQNTGLLYIYVFTIIAALVVISLLINGDYKKYSICYWPLICGLLVIVCLIGVNGNQRGGQFLQNRVLLWFGEISFTFYMIHQLVIRYMSLLFKFILPGTDTYIIVITDFMMCLLCTALIDRFFVKKIVSKLSI